MNNDLTINKPYIHINFTRYSRRDLSRGDCPTCKRKTFFVAFFQEWYGWDSTCLKCGERWTDGEMHERPFMPKWRQKSIESEKRAWRKYLPSEYPSTANKD